LLAGYFIVKPSVRLRQVVAVGVPALVALIVGMYVMLAFRTVGLANYSFSDETFGSVFVDRNLVVIARLTEVFPTTHAYLGWEVPWNALIRPIPRALWPGKPEGLSYGIEEALNVDGSSITLASTFVGEAYMSGGVLAVLVAGLLFGIFASLWNRLGSDISSPHRQLLFASGFLAASIVMRSMLWAIPAILPTIAFWVAAKYWSRTRRRRIPAPAPLLPGRDAHLRRGTPSRRLILPAVGSRIEKR
jgi:hypothetical protein